jgi:hypothetical protein
MWPNLLLFDLSFHKLMTRQPCQSSALPLVMRFNIASSVAIPITKQCGIPCTPTNLDVCAKALALGMRPVPSGSWELTPSFSLITRIFGLTKGRKNTP